MKPQPYDRRSVINGIDNCIKLLNEFKTGVKVGIMNTPKEDGWIIKYGYLILLLGLFAVFLFVLFKN